MNVHMETANGMMATHQSTDFGGRGGMTGVEEVGVVDETVPKEEYLQRGRQERPGHFCGFCSRKVCIPRIWEM